MDDSRTDGTCTLCGRVLDGSMEAETASADGSYCSSGCREIDETLEAPTPTERSAAAEAPGGESRNPGADEPDRRAETYFRIDGMYSPTCETFLETRASGVGGVSDVTASYVTETVRVEHDEQVSQQTLIDALSTLGYDAYVRGDATGSQRAEADAPLRSREMDGIRKRRSDQFLSLRYAAGVLFGTFLLVPYVILVYPAHLAALFDATFLEPFENSFRLGGLTGLLFLRLYLVLTGFVLFFTGLPVLRGAYASLRTREPNTDLLVALTVCSAFLYGVLSTVTGGNDVFFDLTLVVAAAVTGAAFYEMSIKQHALEQLTELTVSQVDEARRFEGGNGERVVPVEEVSPGDRLLVREGERIPVDGTVVQQACTVDESVVTGESVPVRREPGDDVVGGAIVTSGAAAVEVDEEPTSGIDRIMESVWAIQTTDHGIRRRGERLTAVVAPALALVAVAVGAGVYIWNGSLSSAVLGALGTVLVGSPWALGLATPLSVASSLQAAMEHDIVVFDETIFERLRDIDVVVFDKTGTLTTGSMEVLEVDAPSSLLEDVATLERLASHPAADAMVAAFGQADHEPDQQQTHDNPSDETARRQSDANSDHETARRQSDANSDHETDRRQSDDRPEELVGSEGEPVPEFSSHAAGVTGTVDGRTVAAGSLDLFAAEGWSVSDGIRERAEQARGVGRLPVVVGCDRRAEGVVVLGDEPREGWGQTLRRLDEHDIELVVLTGDNKVAAGVFKRHDGVDRVFANVPPNGKTEAVRRLAADRAVAMVGDGTNDAPALAAADLGISMGSGTALAADAADLAISTDELGAVETAFEVASAARSRARQNEALALSYNAIAVPVALAGFLNPVTAMVAVVVSGAVIGANSIRPLLPGGDR